MSTERPLAVELLPDAHTDLTGIARTIALEQPAAAHRFVFAFESVRDLLATFPRAGREYPHRKLRARGMRGYTIPGFRNYVVVYVVKKGRIVIYGVLDGRQNLPSALGNWVVHRGPEETGP